ncbi:NifB/NifX family molybdenum-iron cluster-binding protein [archaeon]|nr:NifB/NifX family molybdenum-iron cluster-binding protein [archaeon]
MKIIISSTGKTLDSEMDSRFGRCQYFVIVEIENKKIKNILAVENQGAIQGHGAGFKAAEQIGNLKPDKLITGHLGPNAFDIIEQLKIQTYQGSGTINHVVKKLLKNELELITENTKSYSGINNTQEKICDRIFLPLTTNKKMMSEIAEHFGHAPFFGLYDFKTHELTIAKNSLDHSNPNKSPIDQIAEEFSPSIFFAQGIGAKAITIIKEKGLELKTGNFKTVQEVIDNINNLGNQTKDCGHNH